MKFHITEDKAISEIILRGLHENDGYCPCIYESKGKPEYKCRCKDFIENVKVGEACHCGLFIKDSE